MVLKSFIRRPLVTVIVVFHDMQREALRTLQSLSKSYQSASDSISYEVVALDHGSSAPLNGKDVEGIDDHIRYRYVDTDRVSPVAAINRAVEACRTRFVLINIDGARILSPGILAGVSRASCLFDDPFIYTLGWHLGPDLQNRSVLQGYDQSREDALLDEVNWRENGYRLFDISVLAGSSSGGYFNPIAESNCFALRRSTWLSLGGFDPAFESPGGGLANLDLFQRVCDRQGVTPVCLLGEGTFHQVHGGVATNVPKEKHPMQQFQAEYKSIRGHEWRMQETLSPFYLGHMPSQARRFVRFD